MTITATDLVQLPRTSAQSAHALGTTVLAAARGQKLPKSVVKSHGRLTAAHVALQTAIVDQFGVAPDSPGEESPAAPECDRIADNCWGGLDGRLESLAKLPEKVSGAKEAAVLRRRLFPTGLDFLKLPYRLQWAEAQTRLQLIERDKLEADIDRLAGKQFLPAIREAHEAYGRVLGMHEPLPNAAQTPQVRGALDAFVKALRDYVVKVVASVDEDDPASQTTAESLLTPLEAWQSTAKRSPSPGSSAAPETVSSSATGTVSSGPVNGAPAKGPVHAPVK